MRDFNLWLNQLRPSIATYDYYVNFDKVLTCARTHKAELHLLNSLVGSTNIQAEFRSLVEKYPQVLSCIPSLLAVRQHEIFARAKGTSNGVWYNFEECDNSIDEYCTFMEKTGLFNVIANHLINNLYDYVIGVETGLDSNGRKNRGGDLMENLVELFIQKENVDYYKEMRTQEINEKWGVNLSALTNGGRAVKRFDFVVRTDAFVYGIEANFYSSDKDGKGGGSKLNETARSYKMLAIEAQGIQGFKFVWITDGAAWRSARQNLLETFEILPNIYNIKELENGIMTNLFL